MATKAFNSLAYARKLKESGVSVPQAEEQAEFMANAFESHYDDLVTKDYLDLRLGELELGLETRMDVRFAEQNTKFTLMLWMMGLGFSVLIIPQLQTWFS